MTKQKPQSEVTYETLLAQKKELENQLNNLNAELDVLKILK
jgi:peptidoglycan hydrolase CwlO-like protein